MSLADIATINVSTTGAGVTRAGYGVPLIVSFTAAWAERTRTYSSLSAVAVDFAANSPEYLAAGKIFGQSPRVTRIMIGRAALLPTQQWSIGVNAVALQQPYSLRVAVPTGVVLTSQDATYVSGNGATGWSPSNTWSKGDLVVADGAKLYSCLGPSGTFNSGGFTGIGAGSGPSGTLSAIREGGIYWMYAGSGNTGGTSNDAIINGLKARIEALGSPTAYATGLSQLTTALAGGAGSQTLSLTANSTAKFFGMQVYNRAALSIKQNHNDPGIATDLAAIKLESNAWYGLITTFNSEALVDAAAAWVEANTKLYPAATQDSAVATVASTSATDVAHDITAAAYARSWAFHHPSNDEFADAAEMGKFFVISPGGETWRMKPLAGVTAATYTDTEITNMKAKHAHFYYEIAAGSPVVGGDAMTGSGEYVDVTRFLDWYQSELQADLADLAISSNKIPFTNDGISLIQAKVEKRNAAGIKAGGIAASPAPVVTVPDVADVTTADKTARELSGVTSEFVLAGAIHHITVSVTASA